MWADVVRAAPPVTPEDLADTGGVTLVVSAHPDDETLGAGRLLAHWARTGLRLRAACLTRGDACFDHLADVLRDLDAPADLLPGMAGRREAEWHAAMEALGVHDRHPHGLPDGGLADDDALDVLRRVADDVTTVLAPWPHDPHPDHRAAGRAGARLAAELGARFCSYPVWMTYWGDPAEADPGLRRVAADPADDHAREAALAAFVSQLEPPTHGIGPIVPPEMLAHHDTPLLHVPTAHHTPDDAHDDTLGTTPHDTPHSTPGTTHVDDDGPAPAHGAPTPKEPR
ncbi:hypothetical protein MOPEL_134_00020 [Mobilicoccus pelagius NBRC 104925]|uniref:Hydrolase n=1 Tax=Mobilicoccus pelagius NBRC 104925 TaxID=1089455 RepID=H5UVG0_9MICO|nr:hypothetical protein MOPEL_134_00020 [Mobilicoccus pelagius NBRC 104925]